MSYERAAVYIGAILAGLIDYITGLHKIYHVLMIAMAVDVALGTLAAVTTGRLSSEASFKGLGKKVMVLVFVFYVGFMAKVLGQDAGVSIPAGEVVAAGYVIRESISIVEKLTAAQVWVPEVVKRALAAAEQNYEGSGRGKEQQA